MGSEMCIRDRYRDGRLEIIPVDKDLEKRVRNWVEIVIRTNPEPFSEETRESWKWMGRDYAERKLGVC